MQLGSQSQDLNKKDNQQILAETPFYGLNPGTRIIGLVGVVLPLKELHSSISLPLVAVQLNMISQLMMNISKYAYWYLLLMV